MNVLQKNVLFSGTILDNLRWGKEDAKRHGARAAKGKTPGRGGTRVGKVLGMAWDIGTTWRQQAGKSGQLRMEPQRNLIF